MNLDTAQLKTLLWIALVGLTCVIAAVVLLVRSGRTVPGSGVGMGPAHGAGPRPRARGRERH